MNLRNRVVLLGRSLGTLLVFGCFSAGAVLLGIPVFFVFTLFIRNAVKRRQVLRWLVKKSMQMLIFLSGLLGVFKVHFLLTDNDAGVTSRAGEASKALPETSLNEIFRPATNVSIDTSGCLITANHPTLVDYVIMVSLMDTGVSTMVKYSLTQGFMKSIVRHLGYVNNQSSYEDITASVSDGSLLIFPEGSRTHGDIHFKRGAANISIRLGIPVIPVFMYCSEPDFLNTGFLNIVPPPHVPHIYVALGERIEFGEDCFGSDMPLSLKARHFNRYLENLYQCKNAALSEYHRSRI